MKVKRVGEETNRGEAETKRRRAEAVRGSGRVPSADESPPGRARGGGKAHRQAQFGARGCACVREAGGEARDERGRARKRWHPLAGVGN